LERLCDKFVERRNLRGLQKKRFSCCLALNLLQPRSGLDCGDHPPLVPMKAATRHEIGAGWDVYEFVVRNFIASISPVKIG
jgi:DNA topoisomerase IA